MAKAQETSAAATVVTNRPLKKDTASEVKAWAKSKIPGFESLDAFVALLLKRRLIVYFAFVSIILLLLFWSYIKVIIVMLLFVAAGAFSMIYNRWVKVSLGVELVMLGLVLSAVLYGRLEAIIVSFAGLFFAEVISGRMTYSTFVSFIGLAVVSLVTYNFYEYFDKNITTVGIAMTILYDAIILPGYILLGSSPARSLLFFVTHVLFNFWIFAFVAPLLFKILEIL